MATASTEETTKTASALVREESQAQARSEENIKIRAANALTKNMSWGKGLTDADRMALEKVALDLGLSTGIGHLILLGGNVFVTFAGHLAIAHSKPDFGGFTQDRAASKEERENWAVAADAEFAWITTVKRGEAEYTEVGWAGGKRESAQPVARQFPGEMARKRARARALSLAYPLSIPSIELVNRGEEIPDDLYKRAMQSTSAEMIATESWTKPKAGDAGLTLSEINEMAEIVHGKRYTSCTEAQILEIIAKLIEERELKENASVNTNAAGEPAASGDLFAGK